MFFSNRCKLKTYPDIVVNGQNLKPAEQFKYPRVTLDPTFIQLFSGHIKNLATH